MFSIATKDFILNDAIRAKEVRVIDEDGSQLGVLPIAKARQVAYDKGFDLVEIAPLSNPPVCRIMDYGKYRFEKEKREKEARKKQQTIDVKEIQLSCRIDTHDFETKLKHAKRFLSDGAKVKVSVRFKSREMSHTNIGFDIIRKFADACSDVGVVEKAPALDGRQLLMFLQSKANIPQQPQPKKKVKPVTDEGAKPTAQENTKPADIEDTKSQADEKVISEQE